MITDAAVASLAATMVLVATTAAVLLSSCFSFAVAAVMAIPAAVADANIKKEPEIIVFPVLTI